MPSRAGAARAAGGGAGVLGAESSHLGAVALDLGVCRWRHDGGGQAEQGAQGYCFSLARHQKSVLPSKTSEVIRFCDPLTVQDAVVATSMPRPFRMRAIFVLAPQVKW